MKVGISVHKLVRITLLSHYNMSHLQSGVYLLWRKNENDAHANPKETFNLEKKFWHNKGKIPQVEGDKLFKPDHFK